MLCCVVLFSTGSVILVCMLSDVNLEENLPIIKNLIAL